MTTIFESEPDDRPWEVYNRNDRNQILRSGNWLYIDCTLRVPRSDIPDAETLASNLELQARNALIDGHPEIAATLRSQAEEYLEVPPKLKAILSSSTPTIEI